jgi:hypothetical protein
MIVIILRKMVMGGEDIHPVMDNIKSLFQLN